MSYPRPISFENLKTYSLFDRPSKVSVEDLGKPVMEGCSFGQFLNCLPNQLAAADLREVVSYWAKAITGNKQIIFAMGAHVIKVGLTPLLIDLMDRGFIKAFALNGAGIIHDCELAMAGKTSEDVAAVLGSGQFGAAKETGEFLNYAINKAASEGKGLGQTLGRELITQGFKFNDYSLLAQAAKRQVPVTVHVAIGTDIIHIHPEAKGSSLGEASFMDFKLYASLIADLQEGIYFNIGSAVVLPEVFLKALTAVRNLGHKVERFVTVNMDFIRHYRPLTNVVHRPTLEGGKGFNLTGHHEIMLPLLAAALLEELTS